MPWTRKGERFIPFLAGCLIMLLLLSGTGVASYLVGYRRGQAATVNPDKADLSVFWQAWNILDSKFYGDPSKDKRVEGAISGMVAGLDDPYTIYLNPDQSKLFQSNLQGSFGGIGAELELRSGLLTVVAPLQGTPAEKVGLKANDVITQIDGTDVAPLSYDAAINKIRGNPGTKVTLTIVRDGVTDPLKVEITRDTIVVPTVSSQSIGTDNSVLYVKINQFGDDTTDLLSKALQSAVTDGKKGVVIDLRNNPGGLLEQAVSSIGLVIPQTTTASDTHLQQRVAVREQFKDKPEQVYRATTTPIIPSLPVVVLQNAGSASASEIFAGAMKDYGRAKIVGTKSYGKGSVQQLEDLQNGGSIKVTVAHWLTPLGSQINKKGINPDVQVDLASGETISSSDTQVKKALEVLAVP